MDRRPTSVYCMFTSNKITTVCSPPMAVFIASSNPKGLLLQFDCEVGGWERKQPLRDECGNKEWSVRVSVGEGINDFVRDGCGNLFVFPRRSLSSRARTEVEPVRGCRRNEWQQTAQVPELYKQQWTSLIWAQIISHNYKTITSSTLCYLYLLTVRQFSSNSANHINWKFTNVQISVTAGQLSTASLCYATQAVQ